MRWMVDGNNVMGARPDGWWRDRPGAMRRLAVRLAEFSIRSGRDVTVVFDGRPISMPASATSTLEIAFATRRGPNAADDEIARRVATADRPREILVVTSDDALATRVRAHGAVVIGAGAFRRRLED